MMGRFDQVPVDQDTKIRSQAEIRIGEFDALHQNWFWEGISAESLIFLADEVRSLDDAQLETMVRDTSLAADGSQFTIKRDSDGFTFVNFNFRS